MILFWNLQCAYERKICEDKFGGCMKSFSLKSQKANKKIHAYMAVMPMTAARTCPTDDVASRQDISTPSSILIECAVVFDSRFDSYLKFRGYSIRYSILMKL